MGTETKIYRIGWRNPSGVSRVELVSARNPAEAEKRFSEAFAAFGACGKARLAEPADLETGHYWSAFTSLLSEADRGKLTKPAENI